MTGATPPDLPAPVARWLEAARFPELEHVKTLGSTGSGRVKVGPLPWLPIEHRTLHRLGRDQVRDIRLRVGPLPVLRVLDAYVDGRGITKIGPVPSIGPAIDQGAYLAMWVEAIQWPAAWREARGLRWEPIDDAHARLLLPFGDGIEAIETAFDPETSLPNVWEMDRHKTADRKVRWRAEASDLRDFDGVRAWSRIRAIWADDPGPWYEARIDRVVPNVRVDAAVERARRAIERAGRG